MHVRNSTVGTMETGCYVICPGNAGKSQVCRGILGWKPQEQRLTGESQIYCTLLYEFTLPPSLLFLSPLPLFSLSSSSLPFLPLLAHRVRRSFHRPPSCSSKAARQTMKTRRYIKLGTNGLKKKKVQAVILPACGTNLPRPLLLLPLQMQEAVNGWEHS